MKKYLKECEKMTNETFGEQLIKSAREAEAYIKGEKELCANFITVKPLPQHTPDSIKALREKLNRTQDLFGDIFGVSEKTVEAWETGTRKPRTAAARLLALMELHPGYISEVMHIK
jgi:putative transcriptional regulator